MLGFEFCHYDCSENSKEWVSDRKVGFSRNLGCALADFYGHYSPRDLQLVSDGVAHAAAYEI